MLSGGRYRTAHSEAFPSPQGRQRFYRGAKGRERQRGSNLHSCFRARGYQPNGLHVVGYVTERARFLRDLTGNQNWTNKSLTAIINSGTIDLDNIVLGISPELRARARIVVRKRLERREEMLES